MRYDIDESAIPEGATVTSVFVRVCAIRGGAQNVNTRLGFCVAGACTECATTFAATSAYADYDCSVDIPDDVFAAGDDYEIYVQNEQARNVLVTAISVDITYTPPAAAGGGVGMRRGYWH